jgi:peptidoglycan-N-acetylglucosamine deacetylase
VSARRRRLRQHRLATSALVLALAALSGLAVGARGFDAGPGVATTQTTPGQPRKTSARTPFQRLLQSGLPLYCGGRREREVALTFDDGPGPFTFQLLRELRRGHAPATFFLVGNRITRWLSGARAEAKLGELGDHTWGHEFLPGLRHGNAVWQIELGRREIVRRTGVWTSLFRPPYGAMTRRLRRLVRQKRMVEILWSVDGRDYVRGATPSSVRTAVEEGLAPGAIIGLHEIHAQTIAALPVVLRELRRRHLRPVTITQLIRDDAPKASRLRAGLFGCVRGTLGTGH